MAKSTIVDITGQPFQLPDLEEQQTESNAKLAQLHNHYGDHPSSGLTPAKIARILKAAERGDLIAQCELAEDMEEKDAHIQSELGKRRLAMQGVDWNITPPPDASAAEKRDAEMIEALLRSATWLDEAVFDSGDAILKAFSNQELKWDREGNEHYIADAEWRDPSWFQINPEKRNQLTLRDGSHEGEQLQSFGWISHISKSKSGYLARNGLARVLAWPFLFKNYSVRDLAEFLEIYGLPIRLGKYPTGASEREKLTLLRAVMSIGHNAGGIIPKGMDVEFENAADGGSDPFMAMIGWCERSESKAILGGTLTSQADGKSSTNALGNVHNEVRKEIRDADLKSLANTLTRDVVYPLYVLNGRSYTSPRRVPRFEFDLNEAEDLEQFVTPLKGLVELGMRIPTGWVNEKTKIPEATEGEAVLTLPAVQPAPVALAAQGLAVLNADQHEPLEQIESDLRDQSITDDVIDQIRQLVESAEDFTQLKEQLLALQLDPGKQAETIKEALVMANLLGRYELVDEAL